MRAVIALACAAGCYKPSIVNCQYSCATGSACPEGFVCDQGNCVGSIGEPCGALPDAGDAGNNGDLIGEAGCAFDYTVSNVNPCQFAGITGDWLVLTNHTTTIDTDTGTISGDAPPAGSIHTASLSNGDVAMVVYVGQFDLGRDATFTVHGARPLIIVADTTANIDGIIDFSFAENACRSAGAGTAGMVLAGTGGGGGGGSLGIVTIFSDGAGREGGDSGNGATGGAEGTPQGDTGLTPLLTGCPGANGGHGGGQAGFGGGAIQISARTDIEVLGQLRVLGGGGDSSPGPGSGGGGGGGSGGGILLEAAHVVTLHAGAILCANGGGGGGVNASTKAEDAHCSLAVAHGDNLGGDGETGGSAALPGQPGGTNLGGGGGGGGVGIVRVNGTLDNQGATTSPNVSQ
jgi:hypothetical protein